MFPILWRRTSDCLLTVQAPFIEATHSERFLLFFSPASFWLKSIPNVSPDGSEYEHMSVHPHKGQGQIYVKSLQGCNIEMFRNNKCKKNTHVEGSENFVNKLFAKYRAF